MVNCNKKLNYWTIAYYTGIVQGVYNIHQQYCVYSSRYYGEDYSYYVLLLWRCLSTKLLLYCYPTILLASNEQSVLIEVRANLVPNSTTCHGFRGTFASLSSDSSSQSSQMSSYPERESMLVGGALLCSGPTKQQPVVHVAVDGQR